MGSNTIFMGSSTDQLKAYSHFNHHIYGFIKSMTLKCAVELGIAEAIHNKGMSPVTLSELSQSLHIIHAKKTRFLPQLLRMLTHMGYLSTTELPLPTPNGIHGDNETTFSSTVVGYTLTTAGEMLLEAHPFTIKPYIAFATDSCFIKPWMDLSWWYQQDDQTPFHKAHGMSLWEYTCNDQVINRNINEAMASDSRLVAHVMIENKHFEKVFDGLSSLVDVGGGVGGLAKAIADAFPNIKCTVLDLPQVVGGLDGSANLEYVAGDMFQDIPKADAILLKWLLHDWEDEDCVRILKLCRKAVMTAEKCSGPSGSVKKKVIIIDIVMGDHQLLEEDKGYQARETQLLYDMQMMGILAGKERTEKEWKKLFQDAGFTGGYNIQPVLGFRSLIEVYP